MKKITFIVLFAIANICAFGQSQQDKAQILQLCIDLPGLQQYYPFDTDGTHKQIVVMQHGVSFDTDIEVSKFGKSVQFLDKNEIGVMNITSYFLFWTYKIEQDVAHIDFLYHYLDTENQLVTLRVVVEMQKSYDLWIVQNTNIERK